MSTFRPICYEINFGQKDIFVVFKNFHNGPSCFRGIRKAEILIQFFTTVNFIVKMICFNYTNVGENKCLQNVSISMKCILLFALALAGSRINQILKLSKKTSTKTPASYLQRVKSFVAAKLGPVQI